VSVVTFEALAREDRRFERAARAKFGLPWSFGLALAPDLSKMEVRSSRPSGTTMRQAPMWWIEMLHSVPPRGVVTSDFKEK